MYLGNNHCACHVKLVNEASLEIKRRKKASCFMWIIIILGAVIVIASVYLCIAEAKGFHEEQGKLQKLLDLKQELIINPPCKLIIKGA